jgi:hydrogenase maturation protein HypF
VTRLRLVLRGRVQGVGFREWILAQAREHPVAGFVRNLRDGRTLEIDVEGAEAEVERFAARVLADPPPLARVDSVTRERLAPRGATAFERAPTT